jgi:hypothetical protein
MVAFTRLISLLGPEFSIAKWILVLSVLCGAWTTINTQLQMVCTFIGTHCNYSTCIMRSLKRSSWCYWLTVDCDGRTTCSWSRLQVVRPLQPTSTARLAVEVSWWRRCLEDCWECCYSLRLARWGVLFSEARWSQRVSWSDRAGWSPMKPESELMRLGWLKPNEAREWVDPAGSHLSLYRPAPIAGYIATYRTCRANTRTALLEVNMLTGPRHLADWTVFHVCPCWCLEENFLTFV